MDYCLEYEHLNDDEHVFTHINYEELIHLLDGFGTGFVFIGGAWCRNCQAIISELNEIAKEAGIDKVYNFDPRFVDENNVEEDIRDCNNLDLRFKYYNFIEKIKYKSLEFVRNTLIPRIPVPFFVAIRNGLCVGYYSIELIKDENGLHLDGEKTDRYHEFKSHILSLMMKVNQNHKRKYFGILLNA